MPYEIAVEVSGVSISFAGRVDVGQVVEAIEELSQIHSTSYSIVDLTAVELLDLAVEDMHTMARQLRIRLARPLDYRYAVVGPAPLLDEMLDLYLTVLDLLTGRLEPFDPVVERFSDVDEARRWARS